MAEPIQYSLVERSRRELLREIWHEIATRLCDHCQHEASTGLSDLAGFLHTPSPTNRRTLLNLALTCRDMLRAMGTVILHHVPFSVVGINNPGQGTLTQANLFGNKNRLMLLREAIQETAALKSAWNLTKVLQIDQHGWKDISQREKSKRRPPSRPITADQGFPGGPASRQWIEPQLHDDQMISYSLLEIFCHVTKFVCLDLAQLDYPTLLALRQVAIEMRQKRMRYHSLKLIRVRWEKEGNYPLASTLPEESIISLAQMNLFLGRAPHLEHLELFNCPAAIIDCRGRPDSPDWLPNDILPDIPKVTHLEIHNPTFLFTGRQLDSILRSCPSLDTLVYFTSNPIPNSNWHDLLEPSAKNEPTFPSTSAYFQLLTHPPIAPFFGKLLDRAFHDANYKDPNPLPRSLRRLLVVFPRDGTGTLRSLAHMTTLKELYLGANAAFYNIGVPASAFSTHNGVEIPTGHFGLVQLIPENLEHLCLFGLALNRDRIPPMLGMMDLSDEIKRGRFKRLRRVTICPVVEGPDGE
ncbi:hypothetical protein B0T16DRAFT_455847 [Cercophora newfieldiana]|uniref:Uncharacterized protein n=1 Tax=Cercophora newfieldiana TaxID=92897 RepID=A0AA40CRU8_9PEZI|nr:hypothetical protein B0T16DRAFT_455847 [Cercophora newfieldiana]